MFNEVVDLQEFSANNIAMAKSVSFHYFLKIINLNIFKSTNFQIITAYSLRESPLQQKHQFLFSYCKKKKKHEWFRVFCRNP